MKINVISCGSLEECIDKIKAQARTGFIDGDAFVFRQADYGNEALISILRAENTKLKEEVSGFNEEVENLNRRIREQEESICEEKDLQTLWIRTELDEARREIRELKSRLRAFEDYSSRVQRIVDADPRKKEGVKVE